MKKGPELHINKYSTCDRCILCTHTHL